MEEEERQKGEGGKGSVCVFSHTHSLPFGTYILTQLPKALFSYLL